MILENTYTNGDKYHRNGNISGLHLMYNNKCIKNWLFDLTDLKLSIITILI